jgi:hypothetical protein
MLACCLLYKPTDPPHHLTLCMKWEARIFQYPQVLDNAQEIWELIRSEVLLVEDSHNSTLKKLQSYGWRIR